MFGYMGAEYRFMKKMGDLENEKILREEQEIKSYDPIQEHIENYSKLTKSNILKDENNKVFKELKRTTAAIFKCTQPHLWKMSPEGPYECNPAYIAHQDEYVENNKHMDLLNGLFYNHQSVVISASDNMQKHVNDYSLF